MLSLSELQTLKINLAVIREAHEQAEKRLADALDTKKSFEQKAFTLFGAYTTISFALIGVAGSMFKDDGLTNMVMAMGASGFALIVGAVLLVSALHERIYGALGSNPDMWLRSNTVDGDESTLAMMLAYITFHHQERIKASIRSNNTMGALIRWAIYTGGASPLVALLILFTRVGDWLYTLLL